MKKFILLFFFALSINAFAQIPTLGLVGNYPFTGNANDISGSGNNGIVHNATLTTDRFGNFNSAYQFVGNDNNTVSYIVANHTNLPSGNSSRTISAWITHDSYGVAGGSGNDGHPIIGYGTPSANSDNEILFATTSGNNPFLRYGGFNNDMDLTMSYSIQTWYNVVATYDGTTASLYVNDVLLGSGSFPGWNTILDSLVIGTQPNRTRFHNGKIDDILIYNRVLTPTEIASLYNANQPPNVPSYVPTLGLLGWWPFNGNANDESGNGNNGTINGTTLTTDRNGSANSAYNFSGADYIGVSSSTIPATGINNAQLFSLSFWVFDAANNPTESYFGSWNESNGGFYINDYLGSSNAFAVLPNGQIFNTTTNLTGNWHNLIYVFDGSQTGDNNRLKLFVDGVSNTLNYPYSVPSSLGGGASSLLFGARQVFGNPGEFLTGKLDDIGIWNRALTQTEITTLFNSGVSGGGGCTAPTITTTTLCPKKITVNWSGGGPNYVVYYKKTAPTVGALQHVSVTGATTKTLTVTANSTYDIYVKTDCGGGTYSAASATSTVSTPALLVAPTGVAISNATCHGFTVTWNAVAGANKYKVKYAKVGGPTYTNTITGTSLTFNTLGLNTNYLVSVASVIVCGGSNYAGSYSSAVPATTAVCRDENTIAAGENNLNDILIYPNPTNGLFNISFNNVTNQQVNYVVTNVLGQVVFENTFTENEGTVNRTIELNDVAAGVYSITVKTATGIATKQILITK